MASLVLLFKYNGLLKVNDFSDGNHPRFDLLQIFMGNHFKVCDACHPYDGNLHGNLPLFYNLHHLTFDFIPFTLLLYLYPLNMSSKTDDYSLSFYSKAWPSTSEY